MTEMFEFVLPKIEQINLPEGRRYKTPEGKLYPSVTTVLSLLSNAYINEWRAKVGDEVANEISKKAATRGSRMHELCEKYIRKEKYNLNPFEVGANILFKQLIPYLEKMQLVYALEAGLYSDKIKVAGTVDCIARIDEITYIVDFKSSSGHKNSEDIPGYFMQASAYAIMWYERTGMVIEDIKILISTDEGYVLEYNEKVKNWLPKFVALRKEYDEKHE